MRTAFHISDCAAFIQPNTLERNELVECLPKTAFAEGMIKGAGKEFQGQKKEFGDLSRGKISHCMVALCMCSIQISLEGNSLSRINNRKQYFEYCIDKFPVIGCRLSTSELSGCNFSSIQSTLENTELSSTRFQNFLAIRTCFLFMNRNKMAQIKQMFIFKN